MLQPPDRVSGGHAEFCLPPRERPDLPQRPRYAPCAPQEYFIVPLIATWVRRTIADLRRKPSPLTLFDVGCGEQPFRAELEAEGYAYFSLDVSQNSTLSVDFLCPIDGPLPNELSQRRFGLILCIEVLEHVADWPTCFANLSSLLTNDGYLVVTCPHFYPLHEEPFDFWRPTLHALVHHATAAGLEPVELRTLGDSWDVLGTALATLNPSARDRSLWSRLVTRAIRMSVAATKKLLFRGGPQRLARLGGPLYLTNAAVFRHPGSGPTE